MVNVLYSVGQVLSSRVQSVRTTASLRRRAFPKNNRFLIFDGGKYTLNFARWCLWDEGQTRRGGSLSQSRYLINEANKTPKTTVRVEISIGFAPVLHSDIVSYACWCTAQEIIDSLQSIRTETLDSSSTDTTILYSSGTTASCKNYLPP